MNLASWGNYPKIKSQAFQINNKQDCASLISKEDDLIAYGNGRSYGDSALNHKIAHFKNYNYFLNFNQKTGLLHLQSGVLLSEIIDFFLPRGWFLKVSPGTKFITVGGAIASDIHGKNHHKEGCFSECLESFQLMLSDQKIINCSREENSELFHATCGGMGLTGFIIDAKIHLKKVRSAFINQTKIKCKNLEEVFDVFEKHKNKSYSVAWIDCLAKGKKMGRSIFICGEFAEDDKLQSPIKAKKTIPLYFPSFFLNKLSVKAFNFFYYHSLFKKVSQSRVSFDEFFYPLDHIHQWNRIYGKNGFTQYQFILPKNKSDEGLKKILEKIKNSGKGSFLSVLKLYGKENKNLLSFPLEGYSLALDFKIENGLFDLLEELDKIVIDFGGRVYLSKDAHLKKESFQKSYPQYKEFIKIREKYKLNQKFHSLQSKRIGL